jgi:hypothetical protein
MGRPIKPVGYIERASPRERGMLVGIPFSHDFRPNEEDWELGGIEYLEPLGAFGQVGRPDVGDMVTTDDGGPWEYVQGDCWQVMRPYAYPPAWWLLAGDGRVYTDLRAAFQTARHTWGMDPAWQMRLCRWAAPMGQGVWPQVTVRMPAEWYKGATVYDENGTPEEVWDWWPAWVSLYLPMYDTTEWPDPLLHVIAETDDEFPSDNRILGSEMGTVLETYRSAGLVTEQALMQSRITWQAVRFEWFGDGWVRVGLSNSDQWWWAWLGDDIRMVRSSLERPVDVTVIGQMAAFHMGQMAFEEGRARLRRPVRLPVDASMTEPQFELLASADFPRIPVELGGWELTAENQSTNCDEHQPVITWEKPLFADPRQRILVYNVRSSTAARFGYEQPGATSTTQGSGKLEYLEFTRDISHKGLRGTARFKASSSMILSDWTVGSTLRIHVDWQSGLSGAEEDLEVYLVRPIRTRDAEQRGDLAVYEVEFGDLIEAKLRDHKVLTDWSQAGGRLLGEWFREIWERLEVPGEYVDVCEEAEDIIIPSGIPAGNDSFEAPDGTDPEGHLDEVVFACGFRWGISRGNRPFIATRYAYVDGESVIAWTVDEDGVDEDALPDCAAEWDTSLHANRIKYTIGDGETARVYIKGDSIEDRRDWPGATWEKYVRAESEAEVELLDRAMQEEMERRERPVRFGYVARPNWRPGDYGRCNVGLVNVDDGAAIQLLQQSVEMDAMSGVGRMRCEAAVVWEA